MQRNELIAYLESKGYSSEFGGDGTFATKTDTWGKRAGMRRYHLQKTQVVCEARRYGQFSRYERIWTAKYDTIEIVNDKLIRS